MREIFQLVRHLPHTLRVARGATMGIRQEKGPTVVGIVRRVSYRQGTVTLETEGAKGSSTRMITAPAKQVTYLV